MIQINLNLSNSGAFSQRDLSYSSLIRFSHKKYIEILKMVNIFLTSTPINPPNHFRGNFSCIESVPCSFWDFLGGFFTRSAILHAAFA